MIKGDWKPREEYKTLKTEHKPILCRCKDGFTMPMVVIYSERGPQKGGHFYPCPSSPIFYGDHQFGMWIHDRFDEWMDIPE